MERRSFVKLALAAAVLPPTLLTEGCSGVNVNALLDVVIASGEAILAVAVPGADWLPALTAALTALQKSEESWEAGGTTTAVLIDALTSVENVLAAIPQTTVYAPLVAILVAGIVRVLSELPKSLQLARRVPTHPNPFIGEVALNRPHWWQTHQGAYRAQFNATAVAVGLPQATI